MPMTRRAFLRTLPVLPLAAFRTGSRPTDPDEEHHRDVLDRFKRLHTPTAPIAGDEQHPSRSDVDRALAYFATRKGTTTP